MNRKLPSVIVCLLLVGVTLGVYSRTVRFEFVSYDDPLYVTENEHVQAGLTAEGVAWAFTTGHASNWHPLTWLSHMLDCELFGLNPAGHHAMNVLLHVANALLLFGVLKAMSDAIWPSALVAALFALHPLHVESVAWVAERKDVLSTFFGLLAMGAYVWYARRPRCAAYLLTALLFTLSLMAKPMLVTLPLVFLLLDYWPLGRIGRGEAPQDEPAEEADHDGARDDPSSGLPFWSIAVLVAEKIPLLLLSAASSVITFLVQQAGGVVAEGTYLPIGLRLANAVVSYVRYLGKTIWPTGLSVLYPHPNQAGGVPWHAWQVAGAASLLVILSLMFFVVARRHRYVATGWLWYLGMMVPVIGLVQAGAQAMADRYTYLPSVGLFIMVAWGGQAILAAGPARILRPAASLVAGAVLSALAVVTWIQLGHWRDSVALYEHALRVTPNNSLIHYNLAKRHGELGQNALAIEHYTKAIELRPDHAGPYHNRGAIYHQLGNYESALLNYSIAIQLRPDLFEGYYNRAGVYARLRQYGAASEDYTEAIRLKPDFAEVYFKRGNVYREMGRYGLALDDFSKAIELNPTDAESFHERGVTYRRSNEIDLAIRDYDRAIALKPDYADAYFNRGNAQREKGQDKGALADYNKAIEFDPQMVEAFGNRAILYFMMERYDEAWADVEQVRKLGGSLHPGYIRELIHKSGRPGP